MGRLYCKNTNITGSVKNASSVTYKDTTVENALDSRVPQVHLTQAEYDALKAAGSLVPGTEYNIDDTDYAFQAEAIEYGSSDVKTALDTINQNITSIGKSTILYDGHTSAVAQTNVTVANLSQFRWIVLMHQDLNANKVINATSIVPYDIFKVSGALSCFYNGSQNYCQIKYVNDTTLTVRSVGYGILVVGVK